jgi:hypothetical protein
MRVLVPHGSPHEEVLGRWSRGAATDWPGRAPPGCARSTTTGRRCRSLMPDVDPESFLILFGALAAIVAVLFVLVGVVGWRERQPQARRRPRHAASGPVNASGVPVGEIQRRMRREAAQARQARARRPRTVPVLPRTPGTPPGRHSPSPPDPDAQDTAPIEPVGPDDDEPHP